MNFYRQVHLAITDFGFYSHVFEQSARRSLIYLLFLAGHVAVIVTLYYAWVVLPASNSFLDWAEDNLPPMRVQEGALIVDADQPLKRYYPGQTVWLLILDTTGIYSDTRGLEEPAVLLTRERLLVRLSGGNNPPPLDWKDVPPFDLPGDFPTIRRAILWGFFPLTYSFWLIWSLLFKALQALLLTPLAMSVASLYGARMPFRSYFTIALYSLTPAIVIDCAVQWTGLRIVYFDLIYLAIAAIYTYMATQRCSMAR